MDRCAPDPTLRALYPTLTDEQLAEAEHNLERYIQLVLRIYERVRSDPEAYARFRTLTGFGAGHTMESTTPSPSS